MHKIKEKEELDKKDEEKKIELINDLKNGSGNSSGHKDF